MIEPPLRSFFALPRNVHESILKTLKGDKTIAVGDWFIHYEGEVCGCLMADDMEANEPEGFAMFKRSWDILGRRLKIANLSALIDFYHMDDISQAGQALMDAAKSFDNWAKANGYVIYSDAITRIGVLTPPGREAMIGLIERKLEGETS